MKIVKLNISVLFVYVSIIKCKIRYGKIKIIFDFLIFFIYIRNVINVFKNITFLLSLNTLHYIGRRGTRNVFNKI